MEDVMLRHPKWTLSSDESAAASVIPYVRDDMCDLHACDHFEKLSSGCVPRLLCADEDGKCGGRYGRNVDVCSSSTCPVRTQKLGNSRHLKKLMKMETTISRSVQEDELRLKGVGDFCIEDDEPKSNIFRISGKDSNSKDTVKCSDEVRGKTSLVQTPYLTSQKGTALDISFRESFEGIPLITAILTNLGFYILLLLGYINQLLFTPKVAKERHRDGYPPLYDAFERFYLRYVYRRLKDLTNRPICSVPGANVTLLDRVTHDHGWTFEFTGTKTECLNLGSYNYLGFASGEGPCAEDAARIIGSNGLALCGSRREYGTTPLHMELERLTAEFLGTEDAIAFGMGFATNALNLPSLLSPGCLVVSDEKNHASIILGLKISGATTKVFKHNDMHDLERILRNAVVSGQPKTGAPWKKILIVVEGIYSMEGSIVRLPEVVALKKKYKTYIYLDEAHSVGAMGPNGRGIVDYFGMNPKDVDILMGTFTKSFGSSGGYLAGSKSLINFLRANSHAHCYASTMSPPTVQQIITSMKIVMGLDGTNEGSWRVAQLSRNTKYFRRRLAQMGVITYGHEDSPVIPMLVYLFSKIATVSRTLKDYRIAGVGVGFPATPILQGRIRFCISAAHTKEQLDFALKALEEISESLGLKYSRRPRDMNPIEY